MIKKMSKQSQAKLDQNYRKKPDSCGNCINYKSDIVKQFYKNGLGNDVFYTEEKNRKCGIGGFAVMKSAVCDKHELKMTNEKTNE